jgi:hypothetical protein
VALDKVKPLKLESTDTGGDEDDQFPTSLDQHEDYIECRGLVLASSDPQVEDEKVVVDRDGDNMTFKDGANTTPLTLSDLVAGTGGLTAEGHKILRQLIHFIDDGPAEGFTSGAYKEITGTVFPTAVVWWESSDKLKKIVERLLSWTGAVVTQDQWKVYDASGTLIATVTDVISYSGIFETNRTRTITVA